MMRSGVVILGLLSLSFVQDLPAQQRAEAAWFQAPTRSHQNGFETRPAERSIPQLALGGAAGGGAGALAGGLLAVGLRSLLECDDQDGCIDGYGTWAVYGAFAGGSALLPLGVHVANRREGRLAPALLASLGIGAAGTAAYWAIQEYGTDGWGNTRGNPDVLTALTVVAVPVLQFTAATAIERRTARRRVDRTAPGAAF